MTDAVSNVTGKYVTHSISLVQCFFRPVPDLYKFHYGFEEVRRERNEMLCYLSLGSPLMKAECPNRGAVCCRVCT